MNIACGHFGIKDSNLYEFFDENGDQVEYLPGNPSLRTVHKILEFNQTKDQKFKDVIKGSKKAVLYLGLKTHF